jgi:hypothetical protein
LTDIGTGIVGAVTSREGIPSDNVAELKKPIRQVNVKGGCAGCTSVARYYEVRAVWFPKRVDDRVSLLTGDAAIAAKIVGGRIRPIARTIEPSESNLNDRERFSFDVPKPLVEFRSAEYSGRVDVVINVNEVIPKML